MDKELVKIIAQYLGELNYLNQQEKNILLKFIMEFEKEKLLSFLKECFSCIKNCEKKDKIQVERASFFVDEKCHFIIDDQEIKIEQMHAKIFFASLIDFLTSVHPLGTIVELKKDFIDSLHIKKEINKVYVVIVERYAMTQDKKAYFQYVGSIYPIGTMGRGQWIHFNDNLIENIVQEGYRDELEDSYVMLMKKEILIDLKALSFGFLNEEDLITYKKELGVKENAKTEY